MALQNFVVLIAAIVATSVHDSIVVCIKINALLNLNRKSFLQVLLPWYAQLTKLTEQTSVQHTQGILRQIYLSPPHQ